MKSNTFTPRIPIFLPLITVTTLWKSQGRIRCLSGQNKVLKWILKWVLCVQMVGRDIDMRLWHLGIVARRCRMVLKLFFRVFFLVRLCHATLTFCQSRVAMSHGSILKLNSKLQSCSPVYYVSGTSWIASIGVRTSEIYSKRHGRAKLSKILLLLVFFRKCSDSFLSILAPVTWFCYFFFFALKLSMNWLLFFHLTLVYLYWMLALISVLNHWFPLKNKPKAYDLDSRNLLDNGIIKGLFGNFQKSDF